MDWACEESGGNQENKLFPTRPAKIAPSVSAATDSMLPRPHAAAAAARALPRFAPGAIAIACGLALHISSTRAQDTPSVDPDSHAGTAPLRNLDARVRLGGEFVHLPQGERLSLIHI